MKYKVGDRVRVKSATGALGHYIGQVGEIDGCSDDNGYIKFPNGKEIYFLLSEDTLELAIRTIEDVQEDDLITRGAHFRRVLGRAGKTVFMTYSYRKNEIESVNQGNAGSIQELKNDNWSIVQDTQEEIQEMTVAEVEKLVGKRVKIIK